MRIGNRSLYVLLTLGVLAAVWAIPSSVAGAETVLSDETSLLETTMNEDDSLLEELSISAEGQELLLLVTRRVRLQPKSLKRNSFKTLLCLETLSE